MEHDDAQPRDEVIPFVCPSCKGVLDRAADNYRCAACGRHYPVICGIPDFRLSPDPYISIDDDRAKGVMLARESAHRTFAEMLHFYYGITPEDPSDLAARWTAHALDSVSIARTLLDDARLLTDEGRQAGALLDVGCSTGALLVAANGRYTAAVGVDVAFRWLVVGQARLREAGMAAALVCANAEHLPFPDGAFSVVTFVDALEHVRDPRAAVGEAHRVSTADARALCAGNNRFALGPEPNVRLPLVGYLPRRWQPRWVAALRGDLHPYRIVLHSAREAAGWFRAAGYRHVRAEAGALVAPHLTNRAVQTTLIAYNGIRRWPLVGRVLTLVGPRITVEARR